MLFEWYDLNARHEATIIWVGGVMIVLFIKSAEVRRSVGHLVKAFLSPFVSLSILGLLLNAAALATGVVILGRMVGFWETLPIVGVTVWAFTSGLTLLMNIEGFVKNDNEFKSKAMAMLAPATITAEVMGNAIFPFWVEFVLIPLGVFFTFRAYVREDRDENRVYQCLLGMFGLVLLTWLIVGWLNDLESWKSVVQSLIFPLILTLGVFPNLKSLILFERCRFLIGVKSKKVTASEYGDDWPLTVDQAKLCCKHDAVWLETEGRRYSLNGWAEPLLKRHGVPIQELGPIRRDHPQRVELASKLGDDGESFIWKADIGRLLEDGRALCDAEK